MEKKLLGFTKQITWLAGCETGWGNGYIVLPEGHKYHGKDYDDIPVDAHGGLTFASAADELDWPEIKPEHKGGWIIGFDCAHYGDNLSTCPKEYVEQEVENIISQLNQTH